MLRECIPPVDSSLPLPLHLLVERRHRLAGLPFFEDMHVFHCGTQFVMPGKDLHHFDPHSLLEHVRNPRVAKVVQAGAYLQFS